SRRTVPSRWTCSSARIVPSPGTGTRSGRLGNAELVVFEDRHARSPCIDPIDLDLRPTDHEVGVDRRVVDPHGYVGGVLDAELHPAAVGDMAGRVLIEQGVAEGQAELAHLG